MNIYQPMNIATFEHLKSLTSVYSLTKSNSPFMKVVFSRGNYLKKGTISIILGQLELRRKKGTSSKGAKGPLV